MMDITLGQFIPGNSCIHRLDPRTKIVLMLVYIVMVFLVKSLALFLLPFFYVLLCLWLGQISFSYFGKAIKPIRFLLMLMFLLNLFITPGEKILFTWKFITVKEEGLLQAVYISLRLILLVTGASIMTLTTSPIALTDGLERMLSPLKVFRFPAHELAMMMTIALRFIPTLMEEADKIRKAQLARGADFESGNIIARAKAMIPILIPLFVSAFRRADELAMAMESRCYHGGEGRTKLHQLKFGLNDLYAVLVTFGFVAVILVVQGLFPGLK